MPRWRAKVEEAGAGYCGRESAGKVNSGGSDFATDWKEVGSAGTFLK